MGWLARGAADEAHAAADVGDHAQRAAAQRLHLGDAERLVDRLAELQVGADAQVGEAHRLGHAPAAAAALPAELVHQADLVALAAPVERLQHVVVRSRISIPCRSPLSPRWPTRPAVFALPAEDVVGAAAGGRRRWRR